MPRPEIEFATPEEELNYGIKVLMEAGFTPRQIERIRDEVGNAPGKTPYTKELIGFRRHMTAELLAANLSNRQIANILKLSKETVNADRHEIRNIYTQEILKTADVHRARLLKEQMELKDTAMQGFEASKRKKITTVKDGGHDDNGGAMVRIEESAGDPSFLTVAKNSLTEQARLLGLHEFQKTETGEKTYKQFLSELSHTLSKEKELIRAHRDRKNAVDITTADQDEEERLMLPAETED